MLKPSPKLIRWSGLLAMVGGAIWIVSWILNGLTDTNHIAIPGFAESEYRKMLDPAMLFFLAALVGLQARHMGRTGKLGTVGFAIAFLGLATMLVGNVVEFRIGEMLYADGPGWEPTDKLGWMVMGIGFMITPPGLILLGIGTLRAEVLPRWSRGVPLGFGLALVALFLIGILLLLLSGNPVQEAWLAILMFAFAIGWMVLGFALWSDRRDESAEGTIV